MTITFCKTMAVRVQKIGPKGQVTLPKHVRDALGLKTGELEEGRPQEAA